MPARSGASASRRDIAEAAAFLLDPERAAWITGETLLVDGGFGTHGEGAGFGGGTSSVVG